MTCASCGAENRPGRKFCAECGSALALACPSCGAANEPGEKFCGDCGTPLAGGAAAQVAPAGQRPAAQPATPTAERRLVSVLFADLVGFTSASEGRDAEDTRELLSKYFDRARQVIERYGGTVEKFIGDAVMAVWGAPTAHEDDAERAVRAALDLVDTVNALGAEIGAPELRVRGGVLTGEAAVTVGATGQGMVAGDLVNTASRIQSAAEPGTVLVGEATRRSTMVSVAYDDAGEHAMKGKAEPMQLWRARQVTAGRGGALKSVGLEAPFVGREREFRLVKELFHSTADERRARLVSVTGVAGVGKSRVLWELFKYVDGLAETIWWHRGRCLAYGEGVAYWALAEMVRGRCEILEEEDAASAVAKLRATLEANVPDAEERTWMEPRLAHLLALEERGGWERDDLFSAWRVFFERLADQGPCVLVFEDLQWGDSGLLDFIEHLLDWSRAHPIFVLTLARPELTERRPDWGAGKRNFTSLFLEPLAAGTTDELLNGLAPGLPAELVARVRDRADGIPLYAVETVRMLLDRGVLERLGDDYRVVGDVERLEVPETLHALVAARLDGLTPAERRLLDDAAVLGRTFSRRALAEVGGHDEAEVEPLLASLVRKEILGIQQDPRSPERGQYGFLQALMQRVAYETLSRSERKARHLAVAAYLERTWTADEEEVVEVLAAHLLDAYSSQPDADDAPALRERAGRRLVEAGERAASLGAHAEAERYFARAVELADSDLERARLQERIAEVVGASGRGEEAARHFERAEQLFGAAGAEREAGRVAARIAEVPYGLGRLEDALARAEDAYARLAGGDDGAFAAVASETGRLRLFTGQLPEALEALERSLAIAERDRLVHPIAQSLITKALVLDALARPEEAIALMDRALTLALSVDALTLAFRGYFNAAYLEHERGNYEEALARAEAGLALARQRGDRRWEALLVSQQMDPLYMLGRWDDALARRDEIPAAGQEHSLVTEATGPPTVRIHVHRGDLHEAERLAAHTADAADSDDVQRVANHALCRLALHRARRDLRRALAEADTVYGTRDVGGPWAYVSEALVDGVETVLELGELEEAERRLADLEALDGAHFIPILRAQDTRLRARVAAAKGDDAGPRFSAAAAHLRELGLPFHLAVTQLEHAEWLVGRGEAEPASELLAEARDTFERLRAQPWLDRLARARAGDAVRA